MRLTCPNCGAQYEVPDEVIPETGRDVQCSNCGDTWFQHHPDHMPPPAKADTPDQAGQTAAAQDQPEYDSEAQAQVEPEPPRRALDSSVRDILREEAEREEQARAAETSSGLETQPDLGLDAQDEDRRTREARARMARLRGAEQGHEPQPRPEPEFAPDHDLDPGSRSNLLPNIDEINSSLDATSERNEDMIAEDADLALSAQNRGSFRRGFLGSILIFVLLTLAYLFAPDIAGLSPALEGPMAAYVETVNALRAWLQDTVASLIG